MVAPSTAEDWLAVVAPDLAGDSTAAAQILAAEQDEAATPWPAAIRPRAIALAAAVKIRAAQTGGASGAIVMEKEGDLQVQYDPGSENKADYASQLAELRNRHLGKPLTFLDRMC